MWGRYRSSRTHSTHIDTITHTNGTNTLLMRVMFASVPVCVCGYLWCCYTRVITVVGIGYTLLARCTCVGVTHWHDTTVLHTQKQHQHSRYQHASLPHVRHLHAYARTMVLCMCCVTFGAGVVATHVNPQSAALGTHVCVDVHVLVKHTGTMPQCKGMCFLHTHIRTHNTDTDTDTLRAADDTRET